MGHVLPAAGATPVLPRPVLWESSRHPWGWPRSVGMRMLRAWCSCGLASMKFPFLGGARLLLAGKEPLSNRGDTVAREEEGSSWKENNLQGPALPCTQSTWMSPLPYSLKPALVLLVGLWVGIFIPQRLPRREEKLPCSPSSLANLRAAAFKRLPGLADLSQRCVCSGTGICSPIAFAARINDHGERRGCLTWLSKGESEQKWLALGKEGK